ncbi:MAG: lacZ [Microbacterium sp.]|nr:lacZ [Microbacterium sp.]
MGNGPGSLQDYWRIINAHDRLCGAFVWEWIDHGFHAVTGDGVPFVMHGDDVDYEPRGGRFSLHGLVFSDRTPTPGLVELAKAHEPVSIEIDERRVRIVNRRHHADTSDLVFPWTVEAAGETVASGVLTVPTVASGENVDVEIPDAAAAAIADGEASAAGDIVLTVEAGLAADALWAPAGHVIAWTQRVAPDVVVAAATPAHPGREALAEAAATVGARPAGRTAATDDGRSRCDSARAGGDARSLTVGAARFDAATGRLVRIGDLEIDGPVVDLYRAPTENDHGQGDLNNVAAVWRKTMLHRLLHRVDEVAGGDGWLRVTGRTAPRTHPHGVEWTMAWAADGDALVLDVEVDFVGPWTDTPYMHRDIRVPRLGLLFGLPGAAERVTWFGRGPGETYVDSFEGARVGRFERSIDELQVPYPVPQENGNHVHTRWLEVAGSGIPRLRVEGCPAFDFTARRWTSHDLDRAAKPHELVDSGRVWLNIDHAQQGLGSASVGPALPEQYRIPRERTSWSVRLESR